MRLFDNLSVLLPVLSMGLSAHSKPIRVDPRDNIPVCTSSTESGPVFVDSTCCDPLYDDPIIDSDEDRIIDGFEIREIKFHYNQTGVKFTISFPSADVFENRFFQNVYPIPLEVIPDDDVVAAHADSGAYTIKSGGALGYRHEAAAAKWSRTLAAEYYGIDAASIYGYVHGGSAGSYQTLGIVENTIDVWQGAVPYIQAIPTSNPLTLYSNAYGALLLNASRPAIIDALQPGGSNDPTANMSDLEKGVWDEMYNLGFPPRGWEALNYTFASGAPTGWATIRQFDPTYKDDFWSLDGYIGTEQSDLGDFFRSLRKQGQVPIGEISYSGANITGFEVAVPESAGALQGAEFFVTDRDGTDLAAIVGRFDVAQGRFEFTAPSNITIPSGAHFRYDNSWFLAVHPLHRYQIPTRPDFYPWDQYRSPMTAEGEPIYPQRDVQIGPLITTGAAGGGTQTGKILFKTIMVQNLLDVNSQPWNADWYRKQVVRQLGNDDLFRVYYQESSDHFETGPNENNNFAPYMNTYQPLLYQALRDVAAWAEKGIEPPRNTQYWVDSSQVFVPYEAADRGGIQPIVHLCVNGTDRKVEQAINTPVEFRAVAAVPTSEGCIVRIAWDWEGTGDWQDSELNVAEASVEIQANHTYSTPGTYFAAVRVASSRECKLDEKYAAPLNLDRVRVIIA